MLQSNQKIIRYKVGAPSVNSIRRRNPGILVSQPLPWPVAPKDVPLMTRRGDLKLSHGATAKARENAVKQDCVPTTNAIKSP